MVTKISYGIKISVNSEFTGLYKQKNSLMYSFTYKITIENISTDTVQLVSRYWDIYDTLNERQIVEGAGVVGVQPILHPGGSYTYSSGCILFSPFGYMRGHYQMKNLTNNTDFKVQIPKFSLESILALN